MTYASFVNSQWSKAGSNKGSNVFTKETHKAPTPTTAPEPPKFVFNPQTPRFPKSSVYIPSLESGWVVFNPGDSKSSNPVDVKEPTVYFTAQVYAEALYYFTQASEKTGEAAAFFLTEKMMPAHPQFLVYDFFIPGQTASAGDVDIYGEETLKYAKHYEAIYPERFGKDVHAHLTHAHSHPKGSPQSWSGTDYTQQTEKTQMGKQSRYRMYLLWQEKECMQASMWIYDPWAVKIASRMRMGLYFGEGMGAISPERKAFIDSEVATKVMRKFYNTGVVSTYTPGQIRYPGLVGGAYPGAAQANTKGADRVTGVKTSVTTHLQDDFDYRIAVENEQFTWGARDEFEDKYEPYQYTQETIETDSFLSTVTLLLAFFKSQNLDTLEMALAANVRTVCTHAELMDKYKTVMSEAFGVGADKILPKHVEGALSYLCAGSEEAPEVLDMYTFAQSVRDNVHSLLTFGYDFWDDGESGDSIHIVAMRSANLDAYSAVTEDNLGNIEENLALVDDILDEVCCQMAQELYN